MVLRVVIPRRTITLTSYYQVYLSDIAANAGLLLQQIRLISFTFGFHQRQLRQGFRARILHSQKMKID